MEGRGTVQSLCRLIRVNLMESPSWYSGTSSIDVLLRCFVDTESKQMGHFRQPFCAMPR